MYLEALSNVGYVVHAQLKLRFLLEALMSKDLGQISATVGIVFEEDTKVLTW